jgi:hypothetical protein
MKAFICGFPAYGRSYKTEQALLEAFLSGSDFSASPQGGPYFSIRDFQNGNEAMTNFTGVILVQKGLANVGLARTEMAKMQMTPDVPYPQHCLHKSKCAGKTYCPRDPICID